MVPRSEPPRSLQRSPAIDAFIEPAETMALTALQALLCAGRCTWEVVP